MIVKMSKYTFVLYHERQKEFLAALQADGIALLKEVAQAGIESEVYMRRMEVLDHARKKTTQKVNLYEKVQIPGYETAILKIRRFLEDEENLSKSAQKIVKSKHEQQEPEAV